MTSATAASGQLCPVPNTPNAASKTARLPITSFRAQIHTDRIFESPSRKRLSMSATAPLAIIARIATAPMVSGGGTVPLSACQMAFAITHKPNAPMVVPLTSAARPPFEREAGNRQADRVIRRVAEKIERVGLERNRARRQADAHLDGKHDRV